MRFVDDKKVKGTRIFKLIVSSLALALAGGLFALPANAGTLTSASFTTNGSGYAATNANNTRYDYGFATATNSTLTRISETVPTGTSAPTGRFLAVNGSVGNEATSPDSIANSIVGDMDIRAALSMKQWSIASEQGIVGKFPSGFGNLAYALVMSSTGNVELKTSTDGTAVSNAYSSVVIPVSNGQLISIRVTMQANDGAGHHVVNFYYKSTTATTAVVDTASNFGWSQLGSTQTITNAVSTFDSSAPVEVGATSSGTSRLTNAKIFYTEIRNGINGPSVNTFNPSDYLNGTTFTSSSPQLEPWSINRTGSNLPTDIATDLTVAETSGLPSGGSASYRLIDNKVVYLLPSATSIAAGTPILLALSGFTNTATSGSYPSTITTFDNSATPLAIDSVTTGTLTFADLAGSAVVGTTVDPTFSFTVATHAGACNSFAQTAGVSSSSTGVALSRVNAASGAVAAQDLSIGTNANTGFNLLLRSSGPLTSGSNAIADMPGTNASPAAFPATTNAAFGYTVSGLSRFSNAWAGATTTNQQIATGSTVGTLTNCIAYKVQVTASTPAGTYATTAIYTAVPSF